MLRAIIPEQPGPSQGTPVWPRPRRPLNIAVSADEGQTFSGETILENDPGLTHAYPSCMESGGNLFVTYYETSYQMGLGTDGTPKNSLVFRRMNM